ncbi:MAG: homospermidine synthase [Micavibrio sp.]
MNDWRQHAKISGPVVMIGFGSIGRGMLPLLERHFAFDKKRFVVIDPDDSHRHLLDERGIRYIQAAVTKENYRELLTPLLTEGEGQGFCVNVSVDVSSLDIIKLCRELKALCIDTVVEPWPGFYYDTDADPAKRTNHALRETVRTEKQRNPGGTTAVSCCGANPGMVSWFVKQALLDIARDTNFEHTTPATREEWAELMQDLGVKGIHIAERDTQRSAALRPIGTFVNTWSVEGFLSEGYQPAELGWGTHEKWKPATARDLKDSAGIYLMQPGANTRVRTWCPTGPQYGFLVTHNESLSIADYFTVGTKNDPQYRPTCHYAYHPSDDAVLSLHELFGSGIMPEKHHILDESEIIAGNDDLGVLLYGHAKNAYWYGSRLSIEQTRQLAPMQNATALQVTSALMAGMVWALENPNQGIVETDEMDHARCLELQKPYLGNVEGHYTDWTPLQALSDFFAEDIDQSDPWQFRNVLMHEDASAHNVANTENIKRISLPKRLHSVLPQRMGSHPLRNTINFFIAVAIGFLLLK